MHGAHKSRNVLRGKEHPKYKHGKRTIGAEAEYSRISSQLLTLRDIGDHINMFDHGHTRGRKPNGYIKFNLHYPEQLILAILKTFK